MQQSIQGLHNTVCVSTCALPRSFIVFRASDVKDLKIEQDAPKQQPPPPQTLQDPAIMSVRRAFAFYAERAFEWY